MTTVLLFGLTARHVAIADKFLMAVQQDDLDTVHGYLSEGFQPVTIKVEMIESLRNLLLLDAEEIIWKVRDLRGNQCSLLGTIKNKSKSTTDIWLGFVKEKSGWKVAAIEAPFVK
ncbi:MAG: hypothetical protein AAGA46_09425 [Cyanobacteria bacterium P01_F01_bin.13]